MIAELSACGSVCKPHKSAAIRQAFFNQVPEPHVAVYLTCGYECVYGNKTYYVLGNSFFRSDLVVTQTTHGLLHAPRGWALYSEVMQISQQRFINARTAAFAPIFLA